MSWISFRHRSLLCLRRLLSLRPHTHTMSTHLREVPWGVVLVQKLSSTCCPRLRFNRQICYQSSILVITYLTYMCYHLTRKPISVVKNVLHQNCSSLPRPPDISPNDTTWCDWVPFNGTDVEANALLGSLDLAFLISYAFAMFFSGFIAERVNLRYFLSIGMLFSGIFSYMFGIAKTYQVHHLSYFICVQIAAGIVQTTGWPGVVTVVSKWFGKGKRGLIFGIWNSHTSIGNILGSIIAAKYVETDWAMSFIMPGLIMGVASFLVFLFLVDEPQDVGLLPPDHSSAGSINTSRRDSKGLHIVISPTKDPYLDCPEVVSKKDLSRRVDTSRGHSSNENCSSDDETEILIRGEQDLSACHRSHRTHDDAETPPPNENTTLLHSHANKQAVGFCGALRIPGVLEFSLSLFFAKLVSYTFLYWLPLYIKNSTALSPTMAAQLSTLFDVGGIIGAILAGVFSDWTGMSACTCGAMLLFAAPMMMVYEEFGTLNLGMNVFLLIVVGLLVNGPYALITTAVSAELGTHSSLEGNSKALATVTAIIDGTGSIGAAIGPMLAALVSSKGWSTVFYMLIVCDFLALILLLRLIVHELKRHYQHRNGPIE